MEPTSQHQTSFKKTLLAIAIGATIAVTGCGSDSSSKTTPENQTLNLTGYAIKGVMINADVKVYDFVTGNLLKETTTNEMGLYSLAGIEAEGETLGNLKVVMTTNANTTTRCDSAVGCTGDDESSVLFGQTYTFHDPDFKLTAILAAPEKETTSASLMVTPLTHMAATRIEAEGTMTSAAIDTVNRELAVLMGMGNTDIATLQPVDLGSSSSADATSDSLKYGAMLAAIATLAEQKGVSLSEMMKQLSESYTNAKGMKSHSSNDSETDLADLFAAAVEAINKAETTLGVNIDNTLEVTMMAMRESAAEATLDDVTVVDLSQPVGDPNLTPQEQATWRGIALLEELNEWNETLVDVEQQLTNKDGAFINRTEDLNRLATAVAEQKDLARAVQTLAYGITEEEVIRYYSYDLCPRWTWSVDLQKNVCTEWTTYNGEFSWTDTYETGVLTNVPYLIQEFSQLANFIADHHDDIQATKDETTGLYQFTLNASLVDEHWDIWSFAYDYGFIYGYEGVDAENTGSLNVSYSLDESDNPASFKFVGHSGFPDEGTAIQLQGLTMEQDVTDTTVTVTISQLDLVDTVGTSLMSEDLDVAVTYSGTGTVTSRFVDADAVEAFLDSEEIVNDKLLSMTLSMESDVSESATDAVEGGFSPAGGELDINLSLVRESEGAPIRATAEAKADIRNAAGDFITGTLTGSGNVSSLETDTAVGQMAATFDGSMSQGIHDKQHEYYGALATFDGSLSLNIPNIDRDYISSYEYDFDGNLSIKDTAGASTSFKGQAKLTVVSPLRADGKPLLEKQSSVDPTDYGDYENQEQATIPTEMSLAGELTSTLENQDSITIAAKASVLLEDLIPVVANIDQKNITAGPIGRIDGLSYEVARIDLDKNTIEFSPFEYDASVMEDMVKGYLKESGITEYSLQAYFSIQNIEKMTLNTDRCHIFLYRGFSCIVEYEIPHRSHAYWRDDVIRNQKYEQYFHFSEEEFASQEHLDPEKWFQDDMIADLYLGGFHTIYARTEHGPLRFHRWWTHYFQGTQVTNSSVDLSYDLVKTIAAGETADNYVGIAASLEVALDAFDHDTSSIQVTAQRTGKNQAEGKLTLKHGARTIEIDLAGGDGSIDADGTQITISNQDTTMTLTANCISLADKDDKDATLLSECDDQDLNFGGSITVDGLDVGKLEDRNGLPVFVFGNGSEYQMIATPSFLISRQ